MKHLDSDLAIARAAAERAGTFIRDRWGQGHQVEHKGTVDLVTEADLGAERIVLEMLRAERPGDAVLAEESGAGAGVAAGRRWCIDPLDGTTNFSHGFPHFCVSIALEDERGPAVGVVYDPLRRWTFSARRGGGAWRDGERLQVSAREDLAEALLATGFPYDRHTAVDNNSHRFSHLLRRAQGMRRAGAAALDLAFVAAGWLDGYWEDRLNHWDLAAGRLLVTEAGGVVTGFDGGPVDLARGALVAAGPHLHPALLRAVSEAEIVDTAPGVGQ